MGEEWKFSQCFGEKVDDPTEADILSAVEFDHTGDYLATGDKGGRIVIFERHPTFGKARGRPSCEYRFYADFQSHEAEFDYLKSLEIEEKINKIRWCKPSNGAHLLLSTNDKTVKLWRIYDKKVRTLSETNVLGNLSSSTPVTADMLRIPRVQATRSVVTAIPRRVFANAHAYHINSISVNSDGESYLSADDLRINLWNLGINDQSFNIVDIKPTNMEELTEVITAAEFHPSQCNVFTYSSSKGSIKLGDMRAAALCDTHAKMFEEEEELVHRSFFSEIIASISDIKFTTDGRYIVSRDYLTLKIWDLNMEARPVQTIQIHEPLRSKLCELYENDCIFDKFEVAVSGDGNNMATGSYDNLFHIYDRYGRTDTVIEASKSQPTKRGRGKKPQDNPNLDFSKKMLHLTWHPQQNIIAAATLNNLYIYCT